MPCLRSMIRLICVGIVFAASTASAAAPTPQARRADHALPGFRPVGILNSQKQAALNRSAGWRQFNDRFGRWTAVWNEQTGTPHRAFGSSIPLRGFAANPASVSSSVRGFVAAHPEVFGGSPTLEPTMVEQHNNVWYARYNQTIQGIPVLFTDWEFRVSTDGKLIAFGADARPAVPNIPTSARLSPAAASEAAKKGLIFDAAAGDRADTQQQLYLMPLNGSSGTEYRLVYDVRVFIKKPRGNYITLVDANTGEILWSHDRVRYANITGTVTGKVHYHLPTDGLATVPFPGANVNVATTQVTTATNGTYSAVCSGTSTVTSTLSGPYIRVQRCDNLSDASFSRSVSCPVVRDILWDLSNSSDGERDAFYHGNVAHNYFKAIDSTYTSSDHQISLCVNSIDDECVSYWDGLDIVFGDGGSFCPNMSALPDVVYHEYTHRVNDDLYYARGAPFGLTNVTLSDACADACAAFIQDEVTIGDGIDGPGTFLRNLSTFHRWPENDSENQLETSLILSGTFWALRESLGLTLAGQLVHFAKYGLPDDLDDGIAMNEYFIDMLVADDNDANLSNGTPHSAAIITAFNNHGIGTNFFIHALHTPLEDQPTNGPYLITAAITYTGLFGGLQPASPTLYYTSNGNPFYSKPMTPTGNPDEYGAEIPGQSGSVVRYYIQASDLNGGVATFPSGAPTNNYSYIAGPASTILSWDMESNPGWTVGATGDSATTGIWRRDIPGGEAGQTGDNHTLGGLYCWVTGDSTEDVDDGKTTLVTSTFNATLSGTYPIISYWRWFSNNAGDNPNIAPWKTEISNNGGGSWVTVENTTQTHEEWQRVVFFVKTYVTPTNNMKMRFIARDDIVLGSLVEAAVDDFDLISFSGPVGVGDPTVVPDMMLAPAAPNPFQSFTRLRYSLPVSGRVDLTVYDIHGREIRGLIHGVQEAGQHSIGWDGRDNQGRPVASGPYFLKLDQQGHQASQAVVRIQ